MSRIEHVEHALDEGGVLQTKIFGSWKEVDRGLFPRAKIRGKLWLFRVWLPEDDIYVYGAEHID